MTVPVQRRGEEEAADRSAGLSGNDVVPDVTMRVVVTSQPRALCAVASISVELAH